MHPQPFRAGGREVLKVARALTPTHRHLRSRLVFLFVATVILDAVASVLIFAFERHAPGTEITNLGDSVFWTSTQLLTVSSQLPNPISTPARVLDVFLQGYAISAVAILAGSFGAFFHRRGMERDPIKGPAGTRWDFPHSRARVTQGPSLGRTDMAEAALARDIRPRRAQPSRGSQPKDKTTWT